MKNEIVEGNMMKLTRWMVKRYFPGCSIYKTRPPVAGRKHKRKVMLLEEAQDKMNQMARGILDNVVEKEMAVAEMLKIDVGSLELPGELLSVREGSIIHARQPYPHPEIEAEVKPSRGLPGELSMNLDSMLENIQKTIPGAMPEFYPGKVIEVEVKP